MAKITNFFDSCIILSSFLQKDVGNRVRYKTLTVVFLIICLTTDSSDYSDFESTSVGTYPVYVRSAYQQSPCNCLRTLGTEGEKTLLCLNNSPKENKQVYGGGE